ncbi:MAG TPA: COX15/CtaA family protein, partial [Propionibacteriaceae bacterium]|nr:COX15/CtaA family protein [Propionibacteriaceae bacterium]
VPMDLTRLVRGPRALPRWAVASLVGNIGIVVTGGLVRLTGSGLGCPTWPRCTEESFVSHPELGVHGAIEFGNRLLTLVLIIIAVLTFVSALLYRDPTRAGRRRDLRWLTGAMALGIPAQGVVGGLTVLTGLNPYLVGLHLLLSMGLISLAVWLVRLTRQWPTRPVSGPLAVLPRVTLALLWVAVVIGTVLTGSGPHAGDSRVPRNGLDGMLLTHLHSTAAYTTVAGTLLCLALLRSRAALLLLAVEVVQAGIGIAQYQLGLPIGLVALHLVGASLAVAAATNLVLSVRRLRTAPEPEDSPVITLASSPVS